METIVFRVLGMTCSGCAASVTRVLQSTTGVQRATLAFDSGRAEVTFDPTRTNITALKAAVEDAGYEFVEQGIR